MPRNTFPYRFQPVRRGDVIYLPNGTTVPMIHGGLVVVFGDCVLGPFRSRHIAEIEASYHSQKLLLPDAIPAVGGRFGLIS